MSGKISARDQAANNYCPLLSDGPHNIVGSNYIANKGFKAGWDSAAELFEEVIEDFRRDCLEMRDGAAKRLDARMQALKTRGPE